MTAARGATGKEAPAAGDADPRVFSAAERTLLAWLRTALAMIGLGFVVSRFGLFIRFLPHVGEPAASSLPAALISLLLVVLGAVMLAGATLRHRSFCRGLGAGQLPARYAAGFVVWMCAATVAGGVALASYLLVTLGSH